MKSISASIVVLAGSVLTAVGGLVQHSDTSMGLMCLGGIVMLVGAGVWIGTLSKRD